MFCCLSGSWRQHRHRACGILGASFSIAFSWLQPKLGQHQPQPCSVQCSLALWPGGKPSASCCLGCVHFAGQVSNNHKMSLGEHSVAIVPDAHTSQLHMHRLVQTYVSCAQVQKWCLCQRVNVSLVVQILSGGYALTTTETRSAL